MEIESRMRLYPDALSSKDVFQTEDISLWDAAMNMADHLIERGYPIGDGMDKYGLAQAIYQKQLKSLPVEQKQTWSEV